MLCSVGYGLCAVSCVLCVLCSVCIFHVVLQLFDHYTPLHPRLNLLFKISQLSPRLLFVYRTTIRYSLVAAMTAQPSCGTSAARSSSRAFITTIKSLHCAWQQTGTHCIPEGWIASYGKISLWAFYCILCILLQ